MELAKSGHVKKDVLGKYLQIQKEYLRLIPLKIIFFDLETVENAEQQAMRSGIKRYEDSLNNLLNEEIKRLEGVK